MTLEKIKKYNITLGSSSPRRKKLLSELGIHFTVKKTLKEESYPKKLIGREIAEFLAKEKANAITKKLSGNFLLITADTIVVKEKNLIHRPKNKNEAKKILQNLSGNKHKVISGVCIKTKNKEVVFSETTEVIFHKLIDEDINYYINNFKPYDKAGSYGIQEWIGYIGIKKINGSYNNVVGFPTAKFYQKLKLFI